MPPRTSPRCSNVDFGSNTTVVFEWRYNATATSPTLTQQTPKPGNLSGAKQRRTKTTGKLRHSGLTKQSPSIRSTTLISTATIPAATCRSAISTQRNTHVDSTKGCKPRVRRISSTTFAVRGRVAKIRRLCLEWRYCILVGLVSESARCRFDGSRRYSMVDHRYW